MIERMEGRIMNTQALFFILLALLWGVWPAWGQGFRSSVGAGPSVGNSAAIGTSAVAALVPAGLAAKLDPAEVLRGG